MLSILRRFHSSFTWGTATLAILAALLFCGGVALALDAAPAPAKAAAPVEVPAVAPPAETAKDPKAMEILLRMASFLAQQPHFAVTVLTGYDAIQEDGERIEFGEKRRVEIQRPDRVRVDVERSDGEKGMMLFDGKQVVASKPADNVYAVVDRPGSADAAIIYLVRDLQLQLPLARMFLTTLPQEMEKQVAEIAYVETNTLYDIPTDHLAVRSAEVDMQIWISQGDKPLPRRVILTYKKEPGEPQFRALLYDWNTGGEAAADRFVFTPSAGAEKVPFVIPSRSQKPVASKKGGAK